MATMDIHPRLLPTAKVLADAIVASGTTHSALARALDVCPNTISNRASGRSSVAPQAARAMADVLGCAWEPLVSPPWPNRGRRKGTKNKPKTNGAAGPASKALALHRASVPANPSAPPPAAVTLPRPTPVLSLELLNDGTASILLRATLPHERASALFRLLLDFNLVQTSDNP